MKGWLVLVVGPSGAGKDSVLRGAAQALSNDARFVFPRRVVTRQADFSAEDHDSISEAEFSSAEASGEYMLSWRAHANGYGIPAMVARQIAQGKVASINVSRHVLRDAVARFSNVVIVDINADPEVRKARIVSRGREQLEDATRRVQRETPPLPADALVIRIENNGAVKTAIASFVTALKHL